MGPTYYICPLGIFDIYRVFVEYHASKSTHQPLVYLIQYILFLFIMLKHKMAQTMDHFIHV